MFRSPDSAIWERSWRPRTRDSEPAWAASRLRRSHEVRLKEKVKLKLCSFVTYVWKFFSRDCSLSVCCVFTARDSHWLINTPWIDMKITRLDLNKSKWLRHCSIFTDNATFLPCSQELIGSHQWLHRHSSSFLSSCGIIRTKCLFAYHFIPNSFLLPPRLTRYHSAASPSGLCFSRWSLSVSCINSEFIPLCAWDFLRRNVQNSICFPPCGKSTLSQSPPVAVYRGKWNLHGDLITVNCIHNYPRHFNNAAD